MDERLHLPRLPNFFRLLCARPLYWGIVLLCLWAGLAWRATLSTALAQDGPPLFFSEVMADPAAVADSVGEWFELYNPGPVPVDLAGWLITDEAGDSHTISGPLVIGVGQFLVLARNGDPSVNGGVQADYVYRGIILGNSEDRLVLVRPDGAEQDRVEWGGAAPLRVVAGASLERAGFTGDSPWQVATAIWPGSAGDRGSPGAAFSPPPTATPTPTPTPEAPPSPTPTQTPSPTPTWTPSPQPTEDPASLSLRLSEFMADPAAVPDNLGEWIELANIGPQAVNLAGWRITDNNRDDHTIAGDLWVAPGGYVVLARNGDPALNGGVPVDYVYSGITLANSEDAIWLFSPGGVLVDRVEYPGPLGLRIPSGASLERAHPGDETSWRPASQPWPGSAGDRGSPGSGYVTPPMPTPSPVPTRPVAFWSRVSEAAPLQIAQVHFLGTDGEFVSLINRAEYPVDLTGWMVGDAERPGANEGIYELPAGWVLGPGQLLVLARQGAGFQRIWGRMPDAEFEASLPIPLLHRRGDLAGGRFALNDSGDEVVLLTPAGQLADAVSYGQGNAAALGLETSLPAYSDYSLQRVPNPGLPLVGDPRQRFLWGPTDPWMQRTFPPAQIPPPVPLEDGLWGLTGTLGARSLFTPGGTAPPTWIYAAAGAHGLHFVALADRDTPQSVAPPLGMIPIPAQLWQGGDGSQAIVYGPPAPLPVDPAELPAALAASGRVAQWLGNAPRPAPGIVAAPADGLTGPAAFLARWESWLAAGSLPLLAGNSPPPLPAGVDPRPRYTGLAAASPDAGGLLAALAAGRGWVTTEPGLVLTLRGADGTWMGGEIQPGEAVDLMVRYQDGPLHGGGAELAGLALWRDGRPVAQADLAPADGVWRVTLPAFPGGLLYAVATQADGDFAVTAPLRVAQRPGSRVLLNELLPVPISDHNGDGLTDSGDEYIELYNPEDVPISLFGWRLEDRSLLPAAEEGDAARRTFTFGRDALIGPRGYLLLWGKESRISLNNTHEQISLYNPAGELVDRIEWERHPGADRSFSRVPDGGQWDAWGLSPGRSNGNHQPPSPATPAPAWGSGAAPGTPGGEAVGPQGSVADAKLRGLGEGVNFEARVIVPPGLFNQAIYVADLAGDGVTAGLGVQVYLDEGEFPPLALGDRLRVRGRMASFRGEREVRVAASGDLWPLGSGPVPAPLAIDLREVGESLEGRFVQFEGVVAGYRGESILLVDPAAAEMEPIPVTVRGSLGWRRPFVNEGERWQVTGVVSQFASAAPWNGGYRVLVRFESDLVRVGR